MPPAAKVADEAQSESAGIENGLYVAGDKKKTKKSGPENTFLQLRMHMPMPPPTSQLLKTEGELITQTKQRHCYYKTCDWDFHSRESLCSSWQCALEKKIIQIILFISEIRY